MKTIPSFLSAWRSDIFAPTNELQKMGVDERLVIAGVNFRKTSLEVRNKFAFTTEHIRRVYTDLNCGCLEEFFILSTCNRTEVYSTTHSTETLLHLLAYENGLEPADLKDYCFIKSGNEAVKHLFRVASGLDSQILGDYEITGQLKNAFMLAKAHSRTNGYMEKLVNISLQASREVKNKTALSDGTTSVSYAAIQQLRQYSQNNTPLHICVLGLGKIGTLTLKNLKHYLPQHRITVINRNEIKSQQAASEFNVDFAPYRNQTEILEVVDVLIVATGADHAVISKADIEKSKVKLIFDLSVPSNVEAAVRDLTHVKVLNIDELSEVVNQTIAQRRMELPLAETIIDEHFDEFRQWEVRRDQYRAKEPDRPVSLQIRETDEAVFSNYSNQKSGSIINHTNCNQNERTCALAGQCCKN